MVVLFFIFFQCISGGKTDNQKPFQTDNGTSAGRSCRREFHHRGVQVRWMETDWISQRQDFTAPKANVSAVWTCSAQRLHFQQRDQPLTGRCWLQSHSAEKSWEQRTTNEAGESYKEIVPYSNGQRPGGRRATDMTLSVPCALWFKSRFLH